MGNLAVRNAGFSTFQHKSAVESDLHSISPSKNVLYSLTCYHSRANDSTGKDEVYEILFTAVQWSGSSSQTVKLRHYPNGPILNVECCKFLATNKNQVHVLQQNSSGWHAQETTAYCLTNTKMDISSYVQDCVHLSLNEACRRRHPVAFFFQLAKLYRTVSNLPVV